MNQLRIPNFLEYILFIKVSTTQHLFEFFFYSNFQKVFSH